MPHTIILGGGLCGLAAGLMLARDGHRVTVLERDAAPIPADPAAAWERWARAGVTQFRQAHYMQPRGRHVLDAELPDVRQALADAGALRFDPLAVMPPTITDRAPREGDERFVTWTARRSTIEHVVARAAEAQDGLEVRRGVSVAALEPRPGRAPVVRTDEGERLTGELVVDAMGRGSALPRLLGAGSVHERTDDGGFLYYTRYFRGEQPAIRGPITAHHGTVLDPHPARRQRHLVGDRLRLHARPLAEGRARRRALDRARAAHRPPRPLAGRRAADRRDGDGRRDEPHARRRRTASTGSSASATPGPARTRRWAAGCPSASRTPRCCAAPPASTPAVPRR